MIDRGEIVFRREPVKMIFGGPMMGISQPNYDVPVLKNTSGVIFLSKEIAGDMEEKNCIRCAKCVDVCPMRLSATELAKNIKAGIWDTLEALCISDCMECGACAYSCPARIPLVQYIKEGKTALRKRKQ